MDSITKLVFLASLLLVVLPSLEDVVGSVLPLVVLLHLPVPLLEGGVGGVDHVGQGLAVVLLLAVAEAQGPHAAHLHDDDGNHGTDEDQHGGFHHLAVADLSVSARHPAGAGDWPDRGWIGELATGMKLVKHFGERKVGKERVHSTSPVALAHLGPDEGPQSSQGSRNPDHSTKHEKAKLCHPLLS